jgi:hypothetical protein
VHIPKTAGTTVTDMLAGAYPKGALHNAGSYIRGPEKPAKKINRITRRRGGWERWQRGGGRVTVGQVPYGFFREHLPPDTRYMTLLREPIDRVLSHYYRLMHRPDLSSAQRLQRRQKGKPTAGSLEEALVQLRLPPLRNLATRYLCGHPSPMGELPANAVEDAKSSLRAFAVVGIQERFEESIVLVQRKLGLGLTAYLNRHVSPDRPAVEEITDEQQELIAEQNQLDAELYTFALRLFENAVAAAGEGFATDVEKQRALSAQANEDAEQLAREFLDRELPFGVTRPRAVLYSAAEGAGVPMSALRYVLERSSVKVERHGDGEQMLTRIGGG